ncbi:MAG: hypothetical protein HYW07_17535 [Candidatus Latescibacteria bacterium]|nr:hypothetical protein [Candidatus Latescibacterota bacterium]
MNKAYRIFACAALLAGWLPAHAQEDFGSRLGVQRGGAVSYQPVGPGVLFDALDPAVKKWYIPQELFNEYQWQQQDYTNYARNYYQRYVSTALEGEYFYDLYGNYLTRGVLIYDWSVAAPQTAGSNLFKRSNFQSWFSGVVIASDAKGQYAYALTIGDNIRTTLTPMTFSKPRFSGIQLDLATDKYQATIIASRPSAPGATGSGTTAIGTGRFRSNDTNLLGGRGTVQLGDFVRLGATYLSAFNAQTKGQAFQGNPFKGTLTEGQNNNDVSRIEIHLSDDSPEDGQAGAAFFQEELIITTIDGKRQSNRRLLDSNILNFEPSIQGGFRQEGYISADGNEVIVLVYDLEGPQYRNAFGPATERIKSIEFVLLLANDYRIDLTSNRQLNSNGQPVLLSEGIPERTLRASGNVQDGSNQRFVKVDYGLPVANEIYGVTLDVTNVGGFYLAGEFDRNRQHFRYPRRAENDVTTHQSSSKNADAWFLNGYKRAYPFFAFGEVYQVEPDYSTSAFLAGVQNDAADIFYDNSNQYVYEFVEDNDDQDRNPDWQRANSVNDTKIFPGYDENNDFINDFNQNDTQLRENAFPDYEEPFLRYNSDRPEFLFGVDMNNNGIVDRFENDNLPDYLYKRDRKGYNVYLGSHLGPEARLTVGRLDERQLADDRDNTSNYLLLTYDRDFPRLGRVQVYENWRRVQDDIRDDVIEWIVREGSRGSFVPYEDPLPMRDAWANTAYLGYNYQNDKMQFKNRIKHEITRQIDYDQRPADQQEIRETSTFFGMINKLDYTQELGLLKLEPRWKSEYERYRPPRKREDPVRVATTELRELLGLVVRVPILNRTELETGVEYLFVNQFRKQLEDDQLRSDRNELVYALQFSNNVAYQGYDLWTQIGFRVSRIDQKSADRARTETAMFITVYAGLQR